MARYVLQRFAALIGILWLISVFCFLLVHILPGNPAVAILGLDATPKSIAQLDKFLGLDKPLWQQYWIWLDNVLHGNLGESRFVGSVRTYIFGAFKVDLELVVISQLIAFAIAIPLSVHSAKRPGKLLDQTATSVTFAFYCLPAFIVVIWLEQWLTVSTHVFPGASSNPYPSGSFFWALGQNLYVLLLPSIVIAIGSVALYYRLLRGEMVATLQEEFITVARSKGLSTRRVLWGHAFRPSTITTLTSTGNVIALLITGLFIVEVKFDLPGIGTALINAIGQPDYLTIQAIALVTAVTVVVVNFVIDIIVTFVDPRIARA